MNGQPDQARQTAAAGLAGALAEGGVSLAYGFLRGYTRLGIGDDEAMLLIQLMAYREKELCPFPTFDQLAERLSAGTERVAAMVQRLLRQDLLRIEAHTDPATGVHSERYDLSPLWRRVAAWQMQNETEDKESAMESGDQGDLGGSGGPADPSGELFVVFEKEFARPLSPMECETIAGWLDKDRYPRELILLALKEAVFAGKLYFRYIDRILLEWQRNRIHNAEEAREFSRNFRGRR